ncbi:MAG: hypothetical protein CBB96_07695 [Gammaproteobacteria bacterium TMED36]|nr:MAG: hypothetical protein CBB96_07695 [Gammaproteobacteria bacterium TMED36]
MANNKIKVDLEVDDHGNLKKTGRGARDAADGLDRTSKSARTADRNLKGAARTSANGTKNFSKMSQGITGGLVPAYATLAANIFAISAAFNFLKRAADVANLEKSQTQFASSTGTAMTSLTNRLREASDGMLGFREAAAATAIGVAKGFSGKQMEDLAEGARKASAALGVGFEDAFDRLVRGASKAEPELLDELGITLRLEEATNRYANAIGKQVKDLTAAERSQAVLVETQRQLNEQFGEAEALSNPFVKLQKTFDDIVKKVTEAILPAFETLARFLTDNAQTAAIVFGLIGLSIAKSIPGVETLSNKLANFGKGSIAAIGASIDEWQKYRAELNKTKADLDDIRQKATKKTVGIAKQLVDSGSKSKTVAKLAKGEDLNKRDKAALARALKNAEKQYKDHGEIVTGIFAGEDIKRVRHFTDAFDQMNRETFTTAQKVKNFFSGGVRGAKIFGKTIAAVVVTPLRLVAATARLAGKAINAAMRAGIILGVITAVLEGLRAMSEAPLTVVKTVIDTISGLAKGLQFGLNVIANAINGLATKLPGWAKKILGIEKGDPLISPFTFADDIKKDLTDIADRMFNLDELAKQEAANDRMKDLGERVKQVGENAKTARKDLDGILKGISKTEGAVQAKIRAKGISTLELSRLIEEATQKGFSSEQTKTALQDVITKLGEDNIRSLSPALLAALQKGDEQGAKDIETINRKFVTELASFEDSLGNLGTQLSGKSKLQQLEFLEALAGTKDEVIRLGGELKLVTDVQEQFNNTFSSLGGLQAYTEIIRQERETIKDLNKDTARINLQRAKSAKFPSLLREQLEKQLVVQEKLNEQLRLEGQLREANRNLALFDANELSALPKGVTRETLEEAQEKIQERLNINRATTRILQDDLTVTGQLADTVAESFGNSMQSAFVGIMQGTMSIKDAFKSMSKAILEALSQVIAKLIAVKILESAISLFGGGFIGQSQGVADAAGGTLGATGGIMTGTPAPPVSGLGNLPAMSPIRRRYGGIAEDPRGYSRGGIARGRDSGYPAMLHGTEAVVPLPNNREIPVDLRGGANTNNVVVNVNMDSSGTSTTTDVQSDNSRMAEMGKLVAFAVQEELQFQKRSGGILSPYGVS